MAMLLDIMEKVNWKDLLALNDSQNEAIMSAARMAEESPDITRALEADFELFVSQGTGKLQTPEETRLKLYGEAHYRLHTVLLLLMRLPWLIEQYQIHEIPERVLRDTLSDVKIWMNVCERKTGYPGLLEFGWLALHFSFKLFRLGRLQFEFQPCAVPAYVYRHKASGAVMALCPNDGMYYDNGDAVGVNGRTNEEAWKAVLREEDGCAEGFPIHRSGYAVRAKVRLNLNEWELALKPEDPVLNMHIAEGSPLNPEAVASSLAAAPGFFKKYLGISGIKALTCFSWLMDDNIGQLQPNGNIASFQRNFYLIPHERSSDWQTRQRVFGDPDIDILQAECCTSLQKAIAAWYAAGRYCRHAAGFILL